jgi:hypothetical protein
MMRGKSVQTTKTLMAFNHIAVIGAGAWGTRWR